MGMGSYGVNVGVFDFSQPKPVRDVEKLAFNVMSDAE
jgi:hypothetical protein